MTTPTNNNIPSSSVQDRLYNAEKFDEFMNSSNANFTDRKGVSRWTLSGIRTVVSNWMASLSAAGGASAVGTSDGITVQKVFDGCVTYAELRTFEPTKQKQIINLNTPINLIPTGGFGYSTGGRFYYDSTDTSTADDGWGCVVTAGGARWKRVIENSVLNLSWMGIKPGDDLSDALQSAVDFVTAFMKKADFYSRPIIAINSGNYTCSKQVTIPSTIGIVAYGNVNIDGSSITDNSAYIFKVTNLDNAITASFWQGDNLSSINGVLRLLGAGRDGTGVSGLFVGNETSGKSQCRNFSVRNMSINNCQNALTFGSIDTYLFSANNLRLEQNWINLNSPNSTSSNSGERMSFTNCIFGGANKDHIYINTPGMDIVYQNCSFDFTSGDVLEIGSSGSYFAQKFTDCHFEGWDGYLVNAPVNATNRAIFFNNCIILPRTRSSSSATGMVNSPSRQLFNGTAFAVYLSGVDMRHEKPAYTEDIFMTPDNPGVSIRGYIKDAYYQCPSPSHITNLGYDFSTETVGATIVNTSSVLNKFKVLNIGGMSGSITARSDGKGNQATLTGSVAGSYGTLISADFIPTSPGEKLGVYAAIQALDAVGNKVITPFVYYYDRDGNAISNKQGLQVNMNNIFADTTLPNYSLGTSRYIASNASVFRSPPGAYSCKVALTVSSFTGSINLSRIVLFKIDD